MIYALLRVATLFGNVLDAKALPPLPTLNTVCEIVRNREKYEGTEVTVQSILVASNHGVVLTGKSCSMGIYVSHEVGRSDGKWPMFDNALVRAASGLETAPLRVRVRGIYHSRVPYGKRSIRQIELNEILEVKFLLKL